MKTFSLLLASLAIIQQQFSPSQALLPSLISGLVSGTVNNVVNGVNNVVSGVNAAVVAGQFLWDNTVAPALEVLQTSNFKAQSFFFFSCWSLRIYTVDGQQIKLT